ncbi:MAG TPA: hypothetical protein VGR61_11895 [Candidatus Dormibacteraeota bacterium]|nr:hypothetical protein [Candidatus Dormibacteraeota bacterium]
MLGAMVIVAAASGRLPHLVVTQAVVSSLLTMIAAPLSLLDRGTGASRRRWSIPAFPAVALMSVGTVASQAPPVVTAIGEGGLRTVVALAALLLMAMGFWSVVVSPARLRGLPAVGYILLGSLPISMPAMFLIMLPRDIYTAFHAAAPGPLAAMDDQIFAGFVLFGFVKITLFVAFTCLFLSAVPQGVDGDDGDDGGRPGKEPPNLPGWVQALLQGEPTVDEPAAERRAVELTRT